MSFHKQGATLAGYLPWILVGELKACFRESCFMKISTMWWGCADVPCSTVSPWAGVAWSLACDLAGIPLPRSLLQISSLLSISFIRTAAGSSAAWWGCDPCGGSWSSSRVFMGLLQTLLSCLLWVVLLWGSSLPKADCLPFSGPSQLGTFKSDDGDYFVEPLLSLEQEYEEEHKKPHLVYRQRTPPTNSSRDRQTCDTPGTRFVSALNDLALVKGS